MKNRLIKPLAIGAILATSITLTPTAQAHDLPHDLLGGVLLGLHFNHIHHHRHRYDRYPSHRHSDSHGYRHRDRYKHGHRYCDRDCDRHRHDRRRDRWD